MSTASLDKTGLPSRHATSGLETAPQRTFYYSMGLTREDIAKPLVGVVSAWHGAAPARDAPLALAESVEDGVWEGGATPRRFATSSDPAGLDRVLVSRELVADTVELTVRGHSYDAVAGVASCVPGLSGLMMVACRLDVPAEIVPCLDRSLGSPGDAYALGLAGERLGLVSRGMTGAGTSAAGLERAARASGLALGGRIRAPLRGARDGVSHSTLLDASEAVGAAGGSAELFLHLLAVAHESGVTIEARELVDSMRGGAPATAPVPRWLAGDLAPRGCLLIDPPGVSTPGLELEVVVRDSEGEAAAAVRGGLGPDRALVLRGQGPRGGPGMPVPALLGEAMAAVSAEQLPGLLVTDGRLGFPSPVAAVVAVTPETGRDAPISTLRDGDRLTLSRDAGRLDLAAGGAGSRTPTEPASGTLPAVLRRYSRRVGDATRGAVTHPGAAGESKRYSEL